MCTGIIIRTKDNKTIFSRTLEFGAPLEWKQFCFKKLKGTYGRFIGTKKWYMTDGVNKAGLFVGTFFFPCNEKEYNKKNIKGKVNLFTSEVNEYLLKECKSIDDVKEVSKKMNIKLTTIQNNSFSLHWIVCDKKGNSVVLEVLKGKLMVYENPVSVITNSPGFPKHLEFLNNYLPVSKFTVPGSCYQGTGQGDPGNFYPLDGKAPVPGLPGDPTSPSRFIRAWFYVKSLPKPKNTKEGLEAALRIMHNFDIPLGSVIEKNGEIEITEYTVAYSINDYKVKYAPYGYIQKSAKNKNKNWIQTSKPVKLCKECQ